MITVKLFARLEEVVGAHTLEYNVEERQVADVIDELEAAHQLNLDTVMVAINEEYADRNSTLQSGDTLALIPPVSGG